MPITIIAWAYKGAMTSSISVQQPLAPLGKSKCSLISYTLVILFSFTDTLEDFANNPYKVGSWYKYTEVKENLIPNPYVIKIGQKYESYAENVEGAYAKLGSGTYSLLESRDSLIFLIRNRFTNKYASSG